jgi:regulatory protein NPR1
MCAAEADATEEFTATSKLKEVGLNETPTMQNRRLLKHLYVLTKTGSVKSC